MDMPGTAMPITVVGMLKAKVGAFFDRVSGACTSPRADDTSLPRDDFLHGCQAAKEAFIGNAGNNYGYKGRIDCWYSKEVGCRLPPHHHYLDYTGSSVYCQSQVKAAVAELKGNMFGNPHSASPSSVYTEQLVEEARDMVLRFFNADPAEYCVVFTKGATGALQLVGETFPWSQDSTYAYLDVNHNSVLGIRSYAIKHGGSITSLDESHVEAWLMSETGDPVRKGRVGKMQTSKEPTCSLFAFPAEDNFAGVKYPLKWVDGVHGMSTKDHKWMVMLDAAAYVPTQKLDLKQIKPAFVSMSFYKMFGYPTGLGALLVRTDAVERLQKVYWGGGTVAVSTSGTNFHMLKRLHSPRLEDGSINFLDIIALRHGFNALARLGGISVVQQHVRVLTEWLYQALSNLRHHNGRPLARVFGKHGAPNSADVQGGIVTIVVLDFDGHVINHNAVHKEAAAAGFHLRTGMHCNPGAACKYLGIQDDEVVDLAVNIMPHMNIQNCAAVDSIAVMRSSGSISSLPAVSRLLPRDVSGKTAPIALDVHPPTGQAQSMDALDVMCRLEIPMGAVRVSLGHMSVFEDCYAFVQWMKHQYTCKS